MALIDHEPDTIATDILRGAAEIARFVYGENTNENRKRIYYAAAKKHLPIGQQGNRLVASKAKLREHYSGKD